MTTPKRHVHLDFETYCALDLKKVGVHKYVADLSFRVLCVAWSVDGCGGRSAQIDDGTQFLPDELTDLLKDPDVQVHAWNAAFETAVLADLGYRTANPLSCTMQRALAYGLPAKLETAGRALGLAQTKNASGHRLMLKLSRPDKAGNQPVPDPAEWLDLLMYCAQDVVAEAAISDVIPTFGPDETALSVIDAAMNWNGVGVDLARVDVLRRVAAIAEAQEAQDCAKLTGGAVTSPGTQTSRLLLWLRAQGLPLADVARATVEDALDGTPLDPTVAEVLQIRLRAAKGSTKKLARMEDMGADRTKFWHTGTLQGQFQFCGAGRTGRWSGRGVQVQNLPRVPKGFSPDAFAAMAEAAVVSHETTLGLNAVTPASVLDCVSWSLRSCLTAGPEALMWGFDFSQIEARVLAWLAGQQDILAVFRSGDDVYVWAAAEFGSTDRQLGKVIVLALGFGMGAPKLRETARKAYGVGMTPQQAEAFKNEWRRRNSRIVTFWQNMELAAKRAVLQRNTVFAVGGSGVAFQATARTLQMRLPSGRVLYYHKPRIDVDGGLAYWGPEVGGMWSEQRTYGGKLAENATQAAARDIMAEAMLRVQQRQGRVPLMTVHDELVYGLMGKAYSAPLRGEAARLEGLCLEPPPWAGGLPIAGEAKLMTRYGVLA